jgi:hypothetical protein
MTIRDLLTGYTSLIAGVLIFFTLESSGVLTGTIIQQTGILTTTAVFPIAIAAMATLVHAMTEQYGVKFMIIGFVI